MKRIRVFGFLLAVGLLGIGGCASQKDSELDAAEFALDSCNPSKPTDQTSIDACNAALADANDVLTSDPTNVQAGVIASSAYLGLAGVDFLQFAKQLVELAGGGSSDFSSFQILISNIETANGKAIDTDKLHSAITILSGTLTGVTVTDDLQKRASFQLGAVQSLETFVKPIKLVTAVTATGQSNLNAIDKTVADALEDDFTKGDGNLVSGGASSTGDTAKAERAAYCLCKNSVFGYGAACLKDLMRCELSSVTPTPTGTEQDYNGDGVCGALGVKGTAQGGGTCTTASTTKDADCNALTSPTGATKTAVDNCKGSNI